jgi:Cu-Zn family superoxide dismutase
MRGLTALTLTAGALLIVGCGKDNANDTGGQLTDAPAVPLVDASGKVIGEVHGGDSDNGARLLVDARGLPPGVHGILIHEIGLCQPPDFKSAGGHWNPTGKHHGSQNAQGAHMGDLENVTVGADGRLRVEIVVPGTYLRNAGRDVAPGSRQTLDACGAALVIHPDPDDYKSDPSGNSGARIACAVLGSPEPGAVPLARGANDAAAADMNATDMNATGPANQSAPANAAETNDSSNSAY